MVVILKSLLVKVRSLKLEKFKRSTFDIPFTRLWEILHTSTNTGFVIYNESLYFVEEFGMTVFFGE
jgi:hypothetical protein